MPTTLDWYMKHIFPFHRGLLKAVRPLAKSRVAGGAAHRQLFRQHRLPFREARWHSRAAGGRPHHERATGHQSGEDVLRETQRAFVYFSLHGLTVDGIIVKRVLPEEVTDVYFQEWRASQAKVLAEIEAYFAPVKVKRVPLFTHEMLGRERLQELARSL